MISYSRQSISQADIDAVVAVLKSDFLTQGPVVEQFEQAFAAACGATYAIAVNSATSALHIACLALGVKAGDWVWTSPNTFVASANCARYCGAEVDFVDIDPLTFNLSVPLLEAKLAAAERANRLPKVIIPVHFAGLPCDMVSISNLARKYGVQLIEDASHAVGARYADGTLVGSGAYSDVTIFSFHPVKIMTTGEGGAATTADSQLARKLARLRSHGITRDADEMTKPSEGPWYYQQTTLLGLNYRMTEFQAALGSSQLVKVPAWVKRRNDLAENYRSLLADFPLVLPAHPVSGLCAYHLYVIQLDEEKTEVSRRQLYDELKKAGIGVNVHYIPVHTQPYYQSRAQARQLPGALQTGSVDYPSAERYYSRCLSIPLYPDLTDVEQLFVVSQLRRALAERPS